MLCISGGRGMASDLSSGCTEVNELFDDEKEEGEISLEDVSSSEEGPPYKYPQRAFGQCPYCLSTQQCFTWCRSFEVNKNNIKRDVGVQGKENRSNQHYHKDSTIAESCHAPGVTKINGGSYATLQEKNDDDPMNNDLVPISSDSDMELVGLETKPEKKRRRAMLKKMGKSRKRRRKKSPSSLSLSPSSVDLAMSIKDSIHRLETGHSKFRHRSPEKKKSSQHRHRSPISRLRLSPTFVIRRARSPLQRKSPPSRRRPARRKSPSVVSTDTKVFTDTVPESPSTRGNVTKLLKKVRRLEPFSTRSKEKGTSLKDKLSNIIKKKEAETIRSEEINNKENKLVEELDSKEEPKLVSKEEPKLVSKKKEKTDKEHKIEDNKKDVEDQTKETKDKNVAEKKKKKDDDSIVSQQKALKTKDKKNVPPPVEIESKPVEQPPLPPPLPPPPLEPEPQPPPPPLPPLSPSPPPPPESQKLPNFCMDDNDEDLELRMIALRSAVLKKHHTRMQKKKKKPKTPDEVPRIESPFTATFNEDFPLLAEICNPSSPLDSKNDIYCPEDMELDSDMELDQEILSMVNCEVGSPYSPSEDIEHILLDKESKSMTSLQLNVTDLVEKQNPINLSLYSPSNPTETPIFKNFTKTTAQEARKEISNTLDGSFLEFTNQESRPYSPTDITIYDPDLPGVHSNKTTVPTVPPLQPPLQPQLPPPPMPPLSMFSPQQMMLSCPPNLLNPFMEPIPGMMPPTVCNNFPAIHQSVNPMMMQTAPPIFAYPTPVQMPPMSTTPPELNNDNVTEDTSILNPTLNGLDDFGETDLDGSPLVPMEKDENQQHTTWPLLSEPLYLNNVPNIVQSDINKISTLMERNLIPVSVLKSNKELQKPIKKSPQQLQKEQINEGVFRNADMRPVALEDDTKTNTLFKPIKLNTIVKKSDLVTHPASAFDFPSEDMIEEQEETIMQPPQQKLMKDKTTRSSRRSVTPSPGGKRRRIRRGRKSQLAREERRRAAREKTPANERWKELGSRALQEKNLKKSMVNEDDCKQNTNVSSLSEEEPEEKKRRGSVDDDEETLRQMLLESLAKRAKEQQIPKSQSADLLKKVLDNEPTQNQITPVVDALNDTFMNLTANNISVVNVDANEFATTSSVPFTTSQVTMMNPLTETTVNTAFNLLKRPAELLSETEQPLRKLVKKSNMIPASTKVVNNAKRYQNLLLQRKLNQQKNSLITATIKSRFKVTNSVQTQRAESPQVQKSEISRIIINLNEDTESESDVDEARRKMNPTKNRQIIDIQPETEFEKTVIDFLKDMRQQHEMDSSASMRNASITNQDSLEPSATKVVISATPESISITNDIPATSSSIVTEAATVTSNVESTITTVTSNVVPMSTSNVLVPQNTTITSNAAVTKIDFTVPDAIIKTTASTSNILTTSNLEAKTVATTSNISEKIITTSSNVEAKTAATTLDTLANTISDIVTKTTATVSSDITKTVNTTLSTVAQVATTTSNVIAKTITSSSNFVAKTIATTSNVVRKPVTTITTFATKPTVTAVTNAAAKIITTSPTGKTIITPPTTVAKITSPNIAREKIVGTSKIIKTGMKTPILSGTPQAVKHLPASQQEEYRRLKQEIFERERLRLLKAKELASASAATTMVSTPSDKLVNTSLSLSSSSLTTSSATSPTLIMSTPKSSPKLPITTAAINTSLATSQDLSTLNKTVPNTQIESTISPISKQNATSAPSKAPIVTSTKIIHSTPNVSLDNNILNKTAASTTTNKANVILHSETTTPTNTANVVVDTAIVTPTTNINASLNTSLKTTTSTSNTNITLNSKTTAPTNNANTHVMNKHAALLDKMNNALNNQRKQITAVAQKVSTLKILSKEQINLKSVQIQKIRKNAENRSVNDLNETVKVISKSTNSEESNTVLNKSKDVSKDSTRNKESNTVLNKSKDVSKDSTHNEESDTVLNKSKNVSKDSTCNEESNTVLNKSKDVSKDSTHNEESNIVLNKSKNVSKDFTHNEESNTVLNNKSKDLSKDSTHIIKNTPAASNEDKNDEIQTSAVNRSTNSVDKSKGNWEDFKQVVDEEVESLSNLSFDEQRKLLRETEEDLIMKRHSVLDDITEMSGNLRQWEIERDLQNILIIEIKKLREQLRIAEDKLQDQKDKLNSIQPKVSSYHEKINTGRKECFRLSKICSGIGQQIIGPNYKVPTACAELLNNRIKEVATHTQKLKNKRNQSKKPVKRNSSTKTDRMKTKNNLNVSKLNEINNKQNANRNETDESAIRLENSDIITQNHVKVTAKELSVMSDNINSNSDVNNIVYTNIKNEPMEISDCENIVTENIVNTEGGTTLINNVDSNLNLETNVNTGTLNNNNLTDSNFSNSEIEKSLSEYRITNLVVKTENEVESLNSLSETSYSNTFDNNIENLLTRNNILNTILPTVKMEIEDPPTEININNNMVDNINNFINNRGETQSSEIKNSILTFNAKIKNEIIENSESSSIMIENNINCESKNELKDSNIRNSILMTNNNTKIINNTQSLVKTVENTSLADNNELKCDNQSVDYSVDNSNLIQESISSENESFSADDQKPNVMDHDTKTAENENSSVSLVEMETHELNKQPGENSITEKDLVLETNVHNVSKTILMETEITDSILTHYNVIDSEHKEPIISNELTRETETIISKDSSNQNSDLTNSEKSLISEKPITISSLTVNNVKNNCNAENVLKPNSDNIESEESLLNAETALALSTNNVENNYSTANRLKQNFENVVFKESLTNIKKIPVSVSNVNNIESNNRADEFKIVNQINKTNNDTTIKNATRKSIFEDQPSSTSEISNMEHSKLLKKAEVSRETRVEKKNVRSTKNQTRNESLKPNQGNSHKKAILPYESILKHLQTPRNDTTDGILCPYELMGTCNDGDCQFIHQTASHYR